MRGTVVLVLAVALGAVSSAEARGLARFRFTISPTGKVVKTWSADGVAANTTRPPPPRTTPPPRPAPQPSAILDGNQIVMRDARGTELRRVPVTRTAYEFVPWHLITPQVFLYAWREPSGKPSPNDYRDVWIAIDLATGAELWRRENLWHDPPGAALLGGDTVLVNDWQKVERIDARTGTVLATFTKTDTCFSVRDAGAGAVLLEAGSDLHLIDRATGAVRWTLGKRGGLVSWTPIGAVARRQGLLQTTEMTYRIDLARGHILWDKPSSAPTRLWVDGNQIYEASFARNGYYSGTVRLVVRRASDGRVTGDHLVQSYQKFFDLGAAEILAVAGGRVTLETTWIILD